MEQTTLDQFLVFGKNQCKNKEYFYVDWDNNEYNPTVCWLDKKPEHITFDSIVNWRDVKYPVHVCCNDSCKVGENNAFKPDESTSFNINTIPLLKSLLQKCIRRQIYDTSLKSAKQIAIIDPDVLVRRISVIMLEDVCYYQYHSVLTWLISAISKGYQIKIYQVNWIMGLIDHMCHNKKKTYIQSFKPTMTCQQLIKRVNNMKLSSNCINSIYSLIFRHSYGGLRGDCNMFMYYADQLMKHNIFDTEPIEIKPIPFEDIKTLDKNDIILNCVDFHCYPNLLKIVNKKFPQYDELLIKKVIWDCNSSYNVRYSNPTTHDIQLIWDAIQPTVTEFQKYIISSL